MSFSGKKGDPSIALLSCSPKVGIHFKEDFQDSHGQLVLPVGVDTNSHYLLPNYTGSR